MYMMAAFRSFFKPKLTQKITEKLAVSFKRPETGLNSLLVRSDEDLGGFSVARLNLHEPPNTAPFVRFQGDISLDLPEDRPEVIRLGYAMFRTKDLTPTLWGLGPSAYHDWSQFNQLSLRVRGDYRKYFINIQADTPYPTDLYQHRLFLKTPGEWETVTVSFANFILTNGGVIQHQQGLNTEFVKSVGISLIDGQYGPFQLDIEYIKVHNGVESEVNENKSENNQLQGSKDPINDKVDTPMGEFATERALNSPKTPGQRLSVDD